MLLNPVENIGLISGVDGAAQRRLLENLTHPYRAPPGTSEGFLRGCAAY